MYVTLMVHAVALRSLNQVSQELRRPHIPVLEQSIENLNKPHPCRRFRIQAKHEYSRAYRHYGVLNNIEGMKQHRSRNIHAHRRMMHLMSPTPQKIEPV